MATKMATKSATRKRTSKKPAKRAAAKPPKQLTHISKLPVPTKRSLDPDLQKYMDICADRLGLVPNVIRAFALRPEKLRTFIAKYNELMLSDETGLSRLEREMIAVVVSSRNHCLYCITSHGASVRDLSKDPVLGDILSVNYREANLSVRHRAMLDYAWKLTETPWLVGDEDRTALKKAKFNDADIFDLTDVVAYFNYTNRMTGGMGMMPNAEYFGQSR
jgi:uncharacterized peroxidase-related enzyme